jgi:hypothetical protein
VPLDTVFRGGDASGSEGVGETAGGCIEEDSLSLSFALAHSVSLSRARALSLLVEQRDTVSLSLRMPFPECHVVMSLILRSQTRPTTILILSLPVQ